MNNNLKKLNQETYKREEELINEINLLKKNRDQKEQKLLAEKEEKEQALVNQLTLLEQEQQKINKDILEQMQLFLS